MLDLKMLAPICEAIPGFASALRHHQADERPAARAAYLELMDQPGLTALCLHQLGLLAADDGDPERAIALFRQAILLNAGLPLFYRSLADGLDRLGLPMAAVDALVDMAFQLVRSGDDPMALSLCQEILGREPTNGLAHCTLGGIYARRGDPCALGHLLTAIQLFGRFMPQMSELADSLRAKLENRLAGLSDQPDLPPDLPRSNRGFDLALTELGHFLREQDFLAEALLCYRLVVELAPGYAAGHFNLSLAELTAGNFASGWREYEWRWRREDADQQFLSLPLRLWQGEDLTGRWILVWAEQGFGDAIQFVPLVRRLIKLGARVVLGLQPPLVDLVRTCFPEIEVIERPDSPQALSLLPPMDFKLPLMSLPDRLRLRRQDLPLALDYLVPSERNRAVWAIRLRRKAANKSIGIVWAGSETQPDNARRSIPLPALKPLFDLPGVQWYSLQLGSAREDLKTAGIENVTDLSSKLHDFSDTAAAIVNLDLVLTVCTSVAHLCGALGRPAWLLARTPSDWRWSGHESTTAWYPSLRIFRQKTAGDWNELIARLALDLTDYLAAEETVFSATSPSEKSNQVLPELLEKVFHEEKPLFNRLIKRKKKGEA